MVGGGEIKPPLIACYRSSKSTARNVCMASDLEAPDRTTKITPNGGSRIDEGICRVLEGFGIRLNATVEEEPIHDVTEETNRRNMLASFRGG